MRIEHLSHTAALPRLLRPSAAAACAKHFTHRLPCSCRCTPQLPLRCRVDLKSRRPGDSNPLLNAAQVFFRPFGSIGPVLMALFLGFPRMG